MPKWIIGIHGLANKSSKPTLRRWWDDSIREGLRLNQGMPNATFKFEMVYWADLLYKYPLHDDSDFGFDKLYNGQPCVDDSKMTLIDARPAEEYTGQRARGRGGEVVETRLVLRPTV